METMSTFKVQTPRNSPSKFDDDELLDAKMSK